jgi:chaperone required for assembly of F1-ATPase
MHDDPIKQSAAEPIDPFALARRDLRKALPRRFYKSAAAAAKDGQFVLLLDGRPALTPAKTVLSLPTRGLAEAVAVEWAAQVEFIDPATMPLTRLANVALDGVRREAAAVVAEIAKYGDSDLLCYRAEAPEALVRAQASAWDPILAANEARLDVRFRWGQGVVFVDQPAPAKAAVRAAVAAVQAETFGHFRLAALHVMTSLTGSALIALALGAGDIDLAEAWAAAHVDDDFQIGLWGEDDEATARQARRFAEMAAAVRLWRLVDPSSD